MSLKTYDISKLTQSNQFDTANVQLFFYQITDFYEALNGFVETMGRALSHYTPAFVVNSEEERSNFLQECSQVRAKLMRIGATELMDTLAVLENAAIHRDFKEFSDGQVKFSATLKMAIDVIKDAETVPEPKPVPKPEPKPEPEQKSAPAKPKKKSTKQKAADKTTIMIVDPYLIDLQKMISTLDQKYHVIGCSDAQSAIAALRARKPHLFLLSAKMPGISGYELAYIIASKNLRAPIWFISDEEVFDPVRAYMPSKQTKYVQKPIETDSLLAMIEEEIGGRE